MKSDARKAELPLEHEVLSRKPLLKSGAKFGASEAELHLEAHHRNEVRCKQGRTPPSNLIIEMKFGASEAELPLEYVTKEAPYEDFIGGEMKFGRTHDLPSISKARTSRAQHEGSLDRRVRRSPPPERFGNYAPLL